MPKHNGETANGDVLTAEVKKVERELSKENRPDSPVVQSLQRQVANGIILYLNYKHYHWQTFGPLFRDLHRLFDELANEVLATVDEFAERIRMIGQDPVSAPSEFVEMASVKPTEGQTSMRAMVNEARSNVLVVIKEMREGSGIADDHDDPGTDDLFSRNVQIHEKHEWFLRDILEKGDGLVT